MLLTNTTLQASLAVDGVLDGQCATTQMQPQPSWSVDLLEERQVYAVELLVQQSAVPVFNIEIWTESTIGQRLLCAKYRGRLESNMLHTFLCEKTIDAARKVSVQALDETSLRLCEVLVLSTRSPSAWQCGQWERMEVMAVHGGQCYAKSMTGQSQSWLQAQNDCFKFGGTLPVHLRTDMQRFLEAQMVHRGDTSDYWIGLMTGGGQWKWADGAALNASQSMWADVPIRSDGQQGAVLSRRNAWRWAPLEASRVDIGWLCQSTARQCPSPSVPEGGMVTISRQPFDVGTSAQYICADGRTLAGPVERVCQPSGVWLPKEAPVCKGMTAVNQPYAQPPTAAAFASRWPTA